MALFQSQVLTQASGSVGGLTYSRNRGGMYIRARTIPTNPNTPQQQIVRANLANLTNLWQSTLTAAQRAAWNVYGASVTMFNRLGQEIQLSGQQHYVRSNAPRLLAGLTRVDAAPTTFNLGTFTPVTADFIADDLQINFTEADDWVGEDGAAMLGFQSRPLNSGVSFFRGPYRFADSIDGDSTTPPTTPSSLTGPFVQTVGQASAARVVVSRADGRLSTVQFLGPQIVLSS